MKHEKYIIIKDDNTDMVSSLKKIDKNIIKEAMKEHDANDIEELAEEIISMFEITLQVSKDDIFTQLFFTNLLNNENSEVLAPYGSDIEDFFVFLYEKDNYLSYYIPDEIKEIIKKELDIEN